MLEMPEYGMEGAPTISMDGMEIEPIEGFDETILDMNRDEVATGVDENRLLDAWYAEFADPVTSALIQQQPGLAQTVAEVVIGRDDRVRITNTRAYPWRCICSLLITARDNSRWIGTGWLCGPGTVITAGHVVYMHRHGGWARRIEVIPGRNAASRPFGSVTVTHLRSVKGWTRKRKRSHDYGAIILPSSNKYGNRLGYFGFANLSFFSLMGLKVNLSGYPGDKPAGTQWWHARRIKFVTPRTLVYNIDTAGGQSGSPVWRLRKGKRHAVGIHTNGSTAGNSATRITRPVYKNIKKWKKIGA
ncbi:MAG: serine protease [candidate division Zixibacteria bacterium]|nr:serine protease [candidate division Zixibacteria bacterium]